MPIKITERIFDTGTVTLNYAEVPSSKRALILLHGGNARWQEFESILFDLAPWHIYAPDFRGHGKSGWIPNHYCLQDYTDDIIVFLRNHLPEPAYLFGHSLGGIIALLVATQYPTGVRAVVVGDAPLSSETWHAVLLQSQERLIAWREMSGGQKSMEELIGLLKNTPIEVPDKSQSVAMREVYGEESSIYAWLATNLYQTDPDVLTALLERFESSAAGYEMETVLPAIQCPVLLLQGDPVAGGLMTNIEVELALRLLARPSHVQLTGVSHVLHNQRKEPVLTAIRRFLLSCDDMH